MNIFSLKKINWKPLPIIFLFGVIYLLIVIINHMYFRTYSYDYGLYNNAFFDYGHFRVNDNPVFNPPLKNFLQDHLAVPLMVFAPLYFLMGWLTGTYTLLIIEVVFILIGGYYTYLLIKLKTNDETISLLALFHFFILIGHFSALGADYHDTVVGASIVPAFLYFMEKRKYLKTIIPFLFVLLTKENFALWLIFITLGLILMNRKDRKHIMVNSGYLVISALYFFLSFKVFIPYFEQPDKPFWNFHYHRLGTNVGDVAVHLITHPIETIKLFFINPTDTPGFDYLKLEFYIVCLLSGGFMLFYRPLLILMFIPIVAQKMLNDRYTCWGIQSYYMIEVVSVLTAGVFLALAEVKKQKLKRILAWGIVISTTVVTLQTLNHRALPWYNPVKDSFYHASHYKAPFDIKKVNQGLKLIPDDASVVAQENLVPHLAFRDHIYCFPLIRDAQYIALLMGQSTYPMKKEAYEEKVKELRSNGKWSTVYDQYPLLILKRVDVTGEKEYVP